MEDEIKSKPDVEFTALVLIDIAYERGLINRETYLNMVLCQDLVQNKMRGSAS